MSLIKQNISSGEDPISKMELGGLLRMKEIHRFSSDKRGSTHEFSPYPTNRLRRVQGLINFENWRD